MRRLAFVVLGLAVGFYLAVTNLVATRVAPDTPVTVLAADSIILKLPVSPDVSRITADLAAALGAAADRATDDRLRNALRGWQEDERFLAQIAVSPTEKFDSGEAIATATPIYDVQLDPDEITVVVLTVELVPGYGSTAGSREHEDGHALINRRITYRCAAEIVAASVEDGNQGGTLIYDVIVRLDAANDPVHEQYHVYVKNASYGQHTRAAERALDEVEGCGD
jgi:hypothetical protein